MFVSNASAQTQQSVTSGGLDFFTGGDFTAPSPLDLLVSDGKSAVLEVISSFEFQYPKKTLKGWGLFEGLKVDEDEIEVAKKSLFSNEDI